MNGTFQCYGLFGEYNMHVLVSLGCNKNQYKLDCYNELEFFSHHFACQKYKINILTGTHSLLYLLIKFLLCHFHILGILSILCSCIIQNSAQSVMAFTVPSYFLRDFKFLIIIVIFHNTFFQIWEFPFSVRFLPLHDLLPPFPHILLEYYSSSVTSISLSFCHLIKSWKYRYKQRKFSIIFSRYI